MDALARVASSSVRARATSPVTPVCSVEALVKVDATEATKSTRVTSVHTYVPVGEELLVQIDREGAETLARARVVAVQVDAVRICCARVRVRCWQGSGERAFINICAEEAITPVTRTRAGAFVAQTTCTHRTYQVGACRVRAALMSYVRAFIDICTATAAVPIAGVPGRALAAERAGEIGAVIRIKTVVRTFCALVDLSACSCAATIAGRACACTTDKMWKT